VDFFTRVSGETAVRVILSDGHSGNRQHIGGLCSCPLISIDLLRKLKSHKIYFPLYSAS